MKLLHINNKLRHAKGLEENEKLSFLSTIYWTIWYVSQPVSCAGSEVQQ